MFDVSSRHYFVAARYVGTRGVAHYTSW